MTPTAVDKMYEEFTRLDILITENDLSLGFSVKQHFSKTLLLAAASHFEARLTETVRGFSEASLISRDHPLVGFVEQATARDYYRWFNWKSGNAQSFFKLFGTKFAARAKEMVNDDAKLDESIQAFLAIGRERNRLVHGDFARFSMDNTTDEIYRRYSIARMFVDWVPDILRQVADEDAP